MISRPAATRSDGGFSVVELAVAGFLASILITGLAGFLINSFRTGLFTEGQAYTINDVRNLMHQIEKEARGAEHFAWCHADHAGAPGSCIELLSETPTAHSRRIQYVHSGSELQRRHQDQDPDTKAWSNWSAYHTVIDRVVNTDEPAFKCDTQTTLLRVIVDLRIEPTPQSDPVFHVQTSFRPRNFPSVATCP